MQMKTILDPYLATAETKLEPHTASIARSTFSSDYNMYNSQRLLRLFHPGSNTASSIDLFLRWAAPFIFVLCRLDKTIKTRSEGQNADGGSYLRQKLLALPNLSVQRREECRLVLCFCQHLIDLRL